MWLIKYFLVALVAAVAGYFAAQRNPITITKEIVRDSLILDTIYMTIDSIHREIKYIEKEHDKEVSDIINFDDSASLQYFSGYIEDYRRATENR